MGIKLILLPGMHGSAALFDEFIAALPDGLMAHAIGYPNNVIQSYPDLLEFLSHKIAASEPYVIVAESFSTPLAIQFAAQNPPNLKGLILAAGFATSPVRGPLQALTPFVAPALGRLPISGIAARIGAPRAAGYEPLMARVRAATAAIQPKVLMDRIQSVVACNALAQIGQISVPVLCLQSRRDRVVHAVCVEEMRRAKPDMDVMVLDGPHLLLQAMPRQTAEIVADFVRRLS
jgi:pimeloyl-[acyl-carrier protein] methyl ester esterase